MLINCDVKGLEVVVAAELSGDPVLKQEIIDKVDIHDSNRVAFGLGDGKPGRLVAKIFKFRLIYGGSAYSYANDPDFAGVDVGRKRRIVFWQDVIDAYYSKYKGIATWHSHLLEVVKRQGYIEIPSGRFYAFEPEFKYGDWKWPLTTIKNYPVQGFGADLVMLARIEAYRLLRQSAMTFCIVGTIHDSIIVDTPKENLDKVAAILKQAVESVPSLCKKHFDYPFSLPLTCEIQFGPNKLDMVDYV
jgi:DNA polymerase-1